jgi:hypothetical protein
MKPEIKPVLMLAGLLAIPSAVTGFCLLLLAVLFRENFHFGNLWHCLVFAVTVVAPFPALIGYCIYLCRQTWKAFWFSLAGSALIGITRLLWTAPLSRGLIH